MSKLENHATWLNHTLNCPGIYNFQKCLEATQHSIMLRQEGWTCSSKAKTWHKGPKLISRPSRKRPLLCQPDTETHYFQSYMSFAMHSPPFPSFAPAPAAADFAGLLLRLLHSFHEAPSCLHSCLFWQFSSLLHFQLPPLFRPCSNGHYSAPLQNLNSHWLLYMAPGPRFDFNFRSMWHERLLRPANMYSVASHWTGVVLCDGPPADTLCLKYAHTWRLAP